MVLVIRRGWGGRGLCRRQVKDLCRRQVKDLCRRQVKDLCRRQVKDPQKVDRKGQPYYTRSLAESTGVCALAQKVDRKGQPYYTRSRHPAPGLILAANAGAGPRCNLSGVDKLVYAKCCTQLFFPSKTSIYRLHTRSFACFSPMTVANWSW